MADDQRHCGELMLSAARAFQKTSWQPRLDVYQTEQGWLLKYELAGVSPQEIELSVRGRAVVLRGRRRDIWVEERKQSYSMEISYNQFERAVELPCDLDTMSVSTDYRDGMLLVRFTCKAPGA